MATALKISFGLNVYDKSKLASTAIPIRMIVNYCGNRYFPGIKHSVLVKHWDSVKQIVVDADDAITINKDMQLITDKILLNYKYMQDKKDIKLSMDEVKQICKDAIDKVRLRPEPPKIEVVSKPEISFYGAYNQFMKDSESGLRRKRVRQTRIQIKESTQKAYATVLNKLMLFDTKQELTFDSIDENFYNEFYQFLSKTNFIKDKLHKVKLLSDSTIGNHLKILKAFLKYSFGKNWHNNNSYLKEYFLCPKENIQRQFLTVDELQRIWQYKPVTDTLQAVKNVFMFQCFSGIRYSDLKKLSPNSIDTTKNLISFDQSKTGGVAFIGLHPFINKILRDTDNFSKNWFILSNDKLNDNIQKLCKNVGLDTEVNVIKVVGGEKKNVYGASKKKYEVVTSHVGRHTFVTLCTNELGLQDETIRIFSGHSGGDSLQRYKHNIELRAVKILNDAMNDFIEETGFHPDK